MEAGGPVLNAKDSIGRHARLEDDDRRSSWASRSVVVEVLVQLTPVPPQPLMLLAHRGPPQDLAPDPTGQLDDRLFDVTGLLDLRYDQRPDLPLIMTATGSGALDRRRANLVIQVTRWGEVRSNGRKLPARTA